MSTIQWNLTLRKHYKAENMCIIFGTYCFSLIWLISSSSVITIYHNITHGTVITVAESESDFRIITDTPQLALTGELWGIYCEDLGENWPRYNGTALYAAGISCSQAINQCDTLWNSDTCFSDTGDKWSNQNMDLMGFTRHVSITFFIYTSMIQSYYSTSNTHQRKNCYLLILLSSWLTHWGLMMPWNMNSLLVMYVYIYIYTQILCKFD